MSLPRSLLLYGHDHALLVVRTLLFERAGYKVMSTLSQQEAERLSDIHALDLLVLCHTLDREEQERTMRAVHVLKPNLKGLALTDGRVAPAADGVAKIVNRFEGPGALLACVKSLVPEQNYRRIPRPSYEHGYCFAGRAENPEILMNYAWPGTLDALPKGDTIR